MWLRNVSAWACAQHFEEFIPHLLFHLSDHLSSGTILPKNDLFESVVTSGWLQALNGQPITNLV